MLTKTIRITYILLVSAIAAVIIHNAVFAVSRFEEPVFFILSLLLILSFFLSIIYSIYTYIRYKRPVDIYRLGFLGLLGLIALIPGFNDNFFAFFSFFAFFGLKK